MKKLLLLFTILIFTSCSNDYLSGGKYLGNPLKDTNAELLQSIDTSKTFFLVVDGDVLTAINSETMLVEYRVEDYSGTSHTFVTFFFVLIVGIWIITIIYAIIES